MAIKTCPECEHRTKNADIRSGDTPRGADAWKCLECETEWFEWPDGTVQVREEDQGGPRS